MRIIRYQFCRKTNQFLAAGLPERKYKTGDRYRYRLTTEVVHNGQCQLPIMAVCELQVVSDSNGIPCDEVRRISKKVKI